MHKVEIQDGVIQVDASIIGRDLGLEPLEVQSPYSQAAASVALMKRRGDTRAAGSGSSSTTPDHSFFGNG